jgi:hypothetical protein
MKKLFIFTLLVMLVGACSSIKMRQYHIKGYVKHGGTFEVKDTTIWLKDTLILNGDTVVRNIAVPCPTPPKPTTTVKDRWYEKQITKRERDSLKNLERLAKINGTTNVKIAKETTKQIKIELSKEKQKTAQLEAQLKNTRKEGNKNWWKWLLVGIILRHLWPSILRLIKLIPL